MLLNIFAKKAKPSVKVQLAPAAPMIYRGENDFIITDEDREEWETRRRFEKVICGKDIGDYPQSEI